MKLKDLNLDTLTTAVQNFIENFPTASRTSFCLVVGQHRWRLQHDVPRQLGAKVGITSANNQSPPRIVARRLMDALDD